MSLDPDSFQSLAGFRLALRRFLAASEGISRAAGITQQQYQALLAVKAGPGEMTIGDLAGQLLLTHHAAVQLVDRMARAGLAERAPSRTDRRSVHVRLTAAGDALVGQLAEAHAHEALRQEPQLTRSLRRLRRSLDKQAGG